MKICPNCKAACQDDDRFCMKCGEPFPENTAESAVPGAEQKPPVYQPPVGYAHYQKEEEHIGVGLWVLYDLIMMIPIVNLIMLFVWGFGSAEKNKTFRNWAKAQLIWIAIGLVLSILFMILLAPLFSQIMAQGSMNSYDFYSNY